MQSSLSAQRKHAIVIGGGIAGLLAARVLLEHFERVTLIERDHYPTEPAARGGVPQGHHVHQMLLGGQKAIEQLFPGISAKLLAHGAVPLDLFADTLSITTAGPLARLPGDPELKGYQCSRLLIEWVLQQEMLSYDHLRFCEGYEVVELLPGKQTPSVGGVRMRLRSHLPPEQQEVETLAADLVVAACGRSSNLTKWLEQLGCELPQETVINAFLGYASRLCMLPPDREIPWKLLLIQRATSHGLRGGAIQLVEGNRWMVVLAGVGRDYPPTDEEGFQSFANSTPDGGFAEVIGAAQPIGKTYGYRRTENRFHHYERLARFPQGLVVLGDAFCSFNPVYGQGMTVAAKEALALDACLRRPPRKDLEQHIQRALAKVVAIPWQLAAASDYRVPQVEGAKPGRAGRWLNDYFDTVLFLIRTDHAVLGTFLRVLHLVIPPTALFHPAIALKVVTHMRTAKRVLSEE